MTEQKFYLCAYPRRAWKMILVINDQIGCEIGSKRKHFEQGKIEDPILSAINIGIAGTSAPSR